MIVRFRFLWNRRSVVRAHPTVPMKTIVYIIISAKTTIDSYRIATTAADDAFVLKTLVRTIGVKFEKPLRSAGARFAALGMKGKIKEALSIRLRIWGSGVRISSGAPILSRYLP